MGQVNWTQLKAERIYFYVLPVIKVCSQMLYCVEVKHKLMLRAEALGGWKKAWLLKVCDGPLTSGSHLDNPVLVVASAACRAAALCLLIFSHVYDVVPAPDADLQSCARRQLIE